MSPWVAVPVAILIGVVIWKIGIASIRSFAPPPHVPQGNVPIEDVDDLDVYLVCEECGTELKVSRLGELQIPRHCGEKMQVVRHPSTD